MRILQVSDLYPPVPGGLERAVATLSARLAGRGHDVEVVTQAVRGAPGTDVEGGVAVHRVRSVSSRLPHADPDVALHPTLPDPAVVAELRRVIRRFRPDVVHAHGWIAYSALAALPRETSARRPLGVVGLHDYSAVCVKKTFVATSQSTGPGSGGPCAGPGAFKCFACAGRHYGLPTAGALLAGMRSSSPLYRRADVFVANSRAVGRASRIALGPGARIEVIPPPVVSPDPADARPSFLPEADGFVMYAGALAPHKGIDVLVEAQTTVGLGAPVVVIGPARHDSPRSWPADVTVVPGAPHHQVLAAWRHAGVAVVPSLWPEPFGMVAVEAMAAGVPVVASATGGLAEIVADGRTGLLVPPGDPDALGKAVRRLVEHPAEAQEMGRAGARRAERYSVDSVLDQLEALYSSGRISEVTPRRSGTPAWPTRPR